MNTKRLVLTLAAILVAQAFGAFAQSPFKLKSHKMTVQGTSTLHDWESEVTRIECSGTIRIERGTLTGIPETEIRIPVEGIKSTKGKTMDSKTHDAFNYRKHPFITYVLTQAKIDGTGSVIETTGNLQMAGTTKPVNITLKYVVLPNGDLQLTGSKKISMRAFGMEPPTAMMGSIRTGDEVTITFHLSLSPVKQIQ
jgi:polyisoprenoid-binding protein YceI